jgi:hypothetical protein
LAAAVRDEVEENLLLHASRMLPDDSVQLIRDYRQLLNLTRPEIVPYPAREEVVSQRHLIRHEADVPILLSAVAGRPDWLLTHNTKHFTPAVSQRTGLRIATPQQFFRTLATLLR